MIAIEFLSRDVERTLGYNRIIVEFDGGLLEPRRLILEEVEDLVTLDLVSVEMDGEIPAGKFERDFPADVDVIHY